MKTYNDNSVMVIGVGAVGCNTIKYISQQQLRQVHLATCDFSKHESDTNIIIDHLHLVESEPEEFKGTDIIEASRNAAVNKTDIIKAKLLDLSPEIVFIVADMGGSTRAGAASEIAHISKELGMLTIAVVTAPENVSDRHSLAISEAGIATMKQHTDTTIVLANEKLLSAAGNLQNQDSVSRLNEYVAHAVRAIAEIVTITAEVNVDVDDVRTVMEGAGRSTVGSGIGSGQGRAMLAAQEAVATALLGSNIEGSDRVLLSIVSGPQTELEMDELVEVTEFLQSSTSEQAEIIFGHALDEDLEDKVRITFIASRFSEN